MLGVSQAEDIHELICTLWRLVLYRKTIES